MIAFHNKYLTYLTKPHFSPFQFVASPVGSARLSAASASLHTGLKRSTKPHELFIGTYNVGKLFYMVGKIHLWNRIGQGGANMFIIPR